VVICRTTGAPVAVILNSISVWSSLNIFQWGVIVFETLMLGSRLMMNEVKDWAKALIKSVLLKGGVEVPGK
jgi:hypothetical protein